MVMKMAIEIPLRCIHSSFVLVSISNYCGTRHQRRLIDATRARTWSTVICERRRRYLSRPYRREHFFLVFIARVHFCFVLRKWELAVPITQPSSGEFRWLQFSKRRGVLMDVSNGFQAPGKTQTHQDFPRQWRLSIGGPTKAMSRWREIIFFFIPNFFL